jgi:hypothetical protein
VDEVPLDGSGASAESGGWPSIARRVRVQSTLGEYQETQTQEAFALQNHKLLKVRLEAVTIQAKLGAMVAYQGEVSFEHAGAGGMGRSSRRRSPVRGRS